MERFKQVCQKVTVLIFFYLLFLAVLEELVGAGRLKGNVAGGRRDKAVYIPDIYSKTQNTWVDSFLHQNGYLGSLISYLY